MLKKIKKTGFTITEVITTLVILGIVLAIAIPGVGKLQTKFRKNYYEQLDGSVVAAAKSYFKDNAESKPSGDLAVEFLSINDLKSKKYIDSIETYKNEGTCSGNVVVLKVKGEYTYHNCMKCTNEAGENLIPGPTDSLCRLTADSEIKYDKNTVDIEPIYLYRGEYGSEALKEKLKITEKVAIVQEIEGVEQEIYSVTTGDTIFPKNITGIDLLKETVQGSENVGIKVEYNNNQSRKIYVYEYKTPALTTSFDEEGATRILFNGDAGIKLLPSKITFDVGGQYPFNSGFGIDSKQMSPAGDKFTRYEYQVKGSEWKKLCEDEISCSNILSQIPETSGEVRFRIVGKTGETTYFYGIPTDYYKLDNLEYDVNFDAKGGSLEVPSIKVRYGAKYGHYEVLPTTTKVGNDFGGWYYDLNDTTSVTNETIVNKTNTHTLYAKWKAIPYTVTFDANGGTADYSTKTVYYGKNYGELPVVTRTGYTLEGWYTAVSGGNKITSSTIMNTASNHTLYARWIANSYIVSLDANGGSVSTNSLTVKYGSQYGTLPEPKQDGFVFNGWYTEKEGGNQITSSTTMNTASNHSLYAQWTEIVIESITDSGCTKKNIAAGVYYIEIIGGGAGGAGRCRILPKPKTAKPYYGGNAAKWSGYVYLPAMNDASVCVGKGSSGTKFGDPENGGSSYISNSSGTKLIEVMGGKSYANIPYSASVTKISNGAIEKLSCKNIVGTVTTKKDYKGDGGYKSSCITTYSNASSGKSGIINYQYIKSLDAWNSSAEICPTTTMCSSSSCGW